MTVNVSPSVDPANLDSLAGAFREVLKKTTMSTDGMLPAKVLSYSEGPPEIVSVQPLIMSIDTNQNLLSKAPIGQLPVFKLGAGGFFIHFPIKKGDIGWILANDRDISNFISSFSESSPATRRLKSFSDAIFIPNVLTGYSISSNDSQKFTIQNLTGSVKITLSDGELVLKAPSVVIDGNVTVTGVLNAQEGISASGGSGPNTMTVDGIVRVIGSITASGSITPDVP